MYSYDALETFKAQPLDFDLVITDQAMPRMNGTELVEKIGRLRHYLSYLF